MKRLLARLRELDRSIAPEHRLNPQLTRDALAAALLHDIGHGPLSHMFEGTLPRSEPHESWTKRIIQDPNSQVNKALTNIDPEMPSRVTQLIAGQHPFTYLAHAVSGTFDVDRCDYLLRDAHATGVRYGNYDLDWLQRSLRFAPPPPDGTPPALAVDGAKGMAAIESFILSRLFMFQQVYLHKATRAAEWMVRTILRRAVHLISNGANLPSVPQAFRTAAIGQTPSLDQYHALDDTSLTTALHEWEECADPALADLCKRQRARKLFKTISLPNHPNAQRRIDMITGIASDITEKAGLDPKIYLGIDVATTTPFDGNEDNLLVVFAKGPPQRPVDVSFILGCIDAKELRRTLLIVAPEVRNDILKAIDAPT